MPRRKRKVYAKGPPPTRGPMAKKETPRYTKIKNSWYTNQKDELCHLHSASPDGIFFCLVVLKADFVDGNGEPIGEVDNGGIPIYGCQGCEAIVPDDVVRKPADRKAAVEATRRKYAEE